MQHGQVLPETTQIHYTFDVLNKLLVVVLQKPFAGANLFFATPTIIYKIDMGSRDGFKEIGPQREWHF